MPNMGKSFATPVYANGRLSVYDKYGSFVARFCDEWSRDAFIKACNEENETNAAISKEKEIWSATPPQEQGLYWHWSGSVDDAPIVLSVLYSGSNKECFVSIGQYGITKAIFCSEYGGFWASCPQPELSAIKVGKGYLNVQAP